MNNENRDLLVDVDVDIPHGVDAALGWLPPDEEKPAKKAKERKPEPADDAIETIRREHADALRRKEEEWRSEVAARDARAAEAEKKAQTNEYYALRAHYDKVASEASQIDTALRAQQQFIDLQKRELEAAHEAGDGRRMASAQDALAEARAHMVQLEAGKSGVAQELDKARYLVEQGFSRRDEPKEEPVKEEPKKALTPDDYIASIRQGVGSKVADWLDENREFITDPKLNTKFLKFADYYATVEEKTLNSKDFLNALNSKFGLGGDEEVSNGSEDGETEVDVEEEPKKKPNVSAPVSRNSAPKGVNNSTSGGKVRLSPDEQSMAVQMYPSLSRSEALSRYAFNKGQAIRDGRYSR